MKGKKGVILAGGKGERLAPLALAVPKPLVTVNGKPLINYNLDLFARHGVNDVKIIIRSGDRELYDRWHGKHAAEFPSMTIAFAEEAAPMGTLGYLAHHLTDWVSDERIFVTNGDDIKNIDLERMIDFHNSTGVMASIALMKTDDASDYGLVTVENEKVVGFLEKGKTASSGLVSAGMYIIDRQAAAFAKEQGIGPRAPLMFEKDLFPPLAQINALGAFLCEGAFLDCGTPERLARAERFLKEM